MAQNHDADHNTGGEPVTVLGAGSVGATLARAWARAGRAVTVGVRAPEADAVQVLVGELGAAARATTPEDAVTSSRIVVVAVPGTAANGLVDALAPAFADRVVVDATNNLADGHASHSLSMLERLAAVAPSAHGFRAFNSVGWENMAEPGFGAEVADLFFAGPDDDTRGMVEQLIADVGFRPVYVGGGADAHRAVDALATLWFALAFGQHHGRRLAFRMLSE
jgi:predicted dinucleotide-binding enzyme